MAAKLIVLSAVLAATHAGFIGAPAVGYPAPAVGYAAPGAVGISPAAITSQQSNILRSFGNLGQLSTSSKTIDTPYSSVRKADVRVTNDAVAFPVAPGLAVHAAPGPVVKAAGLGHSLIGVAYSAAPAVAHMTYSNGLGFSYTY